MARSNDLVADLLQEYADLLAITGGDQFKVRVYERAARSVGGYSTDVATMNLTDLRQIPNVGASIAEKIAEYLADGKVQAFEKLRASIPPGVRELMAVPGLGPRKAMTLYSERQVSGVDDLERAIHDGALHGLRGFGAKTEENLLHGIEQVRAGGGRFLLSDALARAEDLVDALSAMPGCDRCGYAGSLRRMKESIGDIDLLATSTQPRTVMNAFTQMPGVVEVIAKGEKKASVRLNGGIQADLRVVPAQSWGAALQYFTGAKPHNIRTREIAGRMGLKLSEYGLFREDTGAMIVSETEEEVYERLGLPWIAPPLREDRGEIDAAFAGELPALIDIRDIRGDLHTHTDLTDGVSSLPDMVSAAAAHGLRYLAITDHAKDMPMQRMTDAKVLAQRDTLRSLDGRGGLRLLHGTELNISPDGGVDWDSDFLAGFDLCVASIHSHFTQSAKQMTERLVRACENPYVSIIGHPCTRQIGRRPPIDADWDAVFAAAAHTGTAMEVNSFPDRLDLPDELILRAKRFGVKFAINTDSHSTLHLDYLRFGVATAQRGWLTIDDVINAWPLRKLTSFLAAKRRATSARG